MIKMNYAVLFAATAVTALSKSLLQVVHAEQMSSATDSYTWEFDGCDVDTYYKDVLSAMDRSTLQLLLKETHRNVLPYTREGQPGLDDVWSALMDVDQGSIPGTVQLLYTDTQIEAIPFGQRSWVKEQIWPVDRGIGLEPAADLSDVHNIRPTGVLSDIVRGDSYFGECGVLIGEDVTTCQQPAEGSADDTCRCNGRSGAAGLYTPPTTRKGEIARALLYMDLRYDGSEALTEDLRLTDCPFEPETDMAYLSQMIQWHLDDPPSETEIARNDQVCRHWQGNRNPFVDFPELAVMLHYEPYELPAVGERRIYQECESIPTSSPTKEPNTCDFVNVGDIYVWLLNSDDPDSIGLYSFVGLPPGFELYMTDNPWNGTNFLEQEGTVDSDGTLMFTVPDSGLPGGTAWGYGDSALPMSSTDDWMLVQGDFSLNADDGEAIFLYCINADGDQKPLLAFSYGAILKPDGLEMYEENESSLPESLGEIGVQNILPHNRNNIFNSTGEGIADNALKIAVRDPINWIGSNTSRFGVEGSSSATSVFAVGVSHRTWGLVIATIMAAVGAVVV